MTIRPGLTALPDDAFARMPGLRRLDLSYNDLTALPPSCYRLEHLEVVSLCHTRLGAARLGLLGRRFPRVRMDLRGIAVRADSHDPTWRAVHELVRRGRAALMRAPAEAIELFEEALTHCVPGAHYSDYDRLYAHYGVITALGEVGERRRRLNRDQVDTVIRHCEPALELVPDPGSVWHVTDDVAFQEHVTRRAGNALAWHLRERGALDRALDAVERALRGVTDDAEHDYIRDTKVRILLAQGRVHEAYLIVDAVRARNPAFGDFADLVSTPDFLEWRLANAGT